MSKFCISCGAANSDDTSKCSRCGRALGSGKDIISREEKNPAYSEKTTKKDYLKEKKNIRKPDFKDGWPVMVLLIGLFLVCFYQIIEAEIDNEKSRTTGLATSKQFKGTIDAMREQEGVYELKSGYLEIKGEPITTISYYPEFNGEIDGVEFNDFEAKRSMFEYSWECSDEFIHIGIQDNILTASKGDESAEFEKEE